MIITQAQCSYKRSDTIYRQGKRRCRSKQIFGGTKDILTEKFSCGKLHHYKFSEEVGCSLSTHTNFLVHAVSFFWKSKKFFGVQEVKVRPFIFFSSVRLIEHSVGNKRVKNFVSAFSDILPWFSTNQNFWGCTCTLLLHYWRQMQEHMQVSTSKVNICKSLGRVFFLGRTSLVPLKVLITENTSEHWMVWCDP